MNFNFVKEQQNSHNFCLDLPLILDYKNWKVYVHNFKEDFSPSSSYRDILDGEAYAKIKNLKYSDNISLQFNIDGISMYRKSNYPIWPIQCLINELPPNERKDHILMCDLLFGPHKPNLNIFFKPFVTELSNLSRSGFKWIDATNSKQTVSKVFPIICSSDAPTRAAIQNFILYNGKYGYGFCQDSGERVEKAKGSAVFFHFNNHSLKFVLLNNVWILLKKLL
ncbi:hypothetical protein AVEN_77922-1 [Araneus ventricosus]|uniref:Uncharacterized protein n=1 Tax=Araneus ventricosus TaxID=182803 RepID=A0A4Y2DT27_ARAVE|nr:hypothetical protein AVEN_77922-1 [Araneus ventricosus]